MTKKIKTIADLTPDAANLNKGTERGRYLLETSVSKLGLGRSVLADKNGTLIAGNKTTEVAGGLGMDRVRVIETDGTELIVVQRTDLDMGDPNDPRARQLAFADNQVGAQNLAWDAQALLAAAQADDLSDFVRDEELKEMLALIEKKNDDINEPAIGGVSGGLAERFIIPPFTVFNAREGWWQERKEKWINLGIKSELGRGGKSNSIPAHPPTVTKNADGTLNYHGTEGTSDRFFNNLSDGLLFSISSQPTSVYDKKNKYDAIHGKTSWSEFLEKNPDIAVMNGTSIFDPVLCEIAYRWFAPKGGFVIDPFAGGSVRGIVASYLGLTYCGVDLSKKQVESNKIQGDLLCVGKPSPLWIEGDSANIEQLIGEKKADLIFSCPPYYNLEVYSDNERDLSNMTYEKFIDSYRTIIRKSVALLNDNRFAVFVVGEVRDDKGNYRNIVGETIKAFVDAGANYYNEAILVTAVGSLPIRVGKQFSQSRKLGKTHQNVLVFCKGDPRIAASECGVVDAEDVLGGLQGA